MSNRFYGQSIGICLALAMLLTLAAGDAAHAGGSWGSSRGGFGGGGLLSGFRPVRSLLGGIGNGVRGIGTGVRNAGSRIAGLGNIGSRGFGGVLASVAEVSADLEAAAGYSITAAYLDSASDREFETYLAESVTVLPEAAEEDWVHAAGDPEADLRVPAA